MAGHIDRLECFALQVPLPKIYDGSTYRVDSRATIITEAYTSDGAVGRVYNGDPRDTAAEIVSTVRDVLAPLVIGTDPANVGATWDRLFDTTHTVKGRKVLMSAIGCVDCAIWDVRARELGISVASLLGRFARPLPVIAIGGYYHDGNRLSDLRAEIESLGQNGVSGCKMKVGGRSPEEDAERVAAARESSSDGFILAVDANRAWSVDEAAQFADRVRDLNVEWFEEPCHWPADLRDMTRLSHKINIPICAGQSEISSHRAVELMINGAIDVINYDASEGGGVTEWQRVASLADVYGLRVGHHEEPQISSHLLSSVRYPAYVECFPDPQRDPIWANMLSSGPYVKDGSLFPSTEGGFGLSFDQEFIDHYRV